MRRVSGIVQMRARVDSWETENVPFPSDPRPHTLPNQTMDCTAPFSSMQKKQMHNWTITACHGSLPALVRDGAKTITKASQMTIGQLWTPEKKEKGKRKKGGADSKAETRSRKRRKAVSSVSSFFSLV